MPIAPQVEQGSITIKIQVLSHIFEQNLEIGLEVLVLVLYSLFFLIIGVKCAFFKIARGSHY